VLPRALRSLGFLARALRLATFLIIDLLHPAVGADGRIEVEGMSIHKRFAAHVDLLVTRRRRR